MNSTDSWSKWCVAGIVILIVFISLAFSIHANWRGYNISLDLLPHALNAHDFVAKGTIPQKGNLSSLAVYMPPGATWVLMPGILMFADSRLYQLPGTLILFLITLLGVYLLARMLANHYIACAACLLYGLSPMGVYFGVKAWPLGNPAVVVWFVLLCVLWVHRNQSRYLAAALVVWALGMYIHMQLAPMILIPPVIYVVYRPRIKVTALLVAGLVAGLIWLPYVRFDFGEGFTNIRHQLLNQSRFSKARPILSSHPAVRPPYEAPDYPPDTTTGLYHELRRFVYKVHSFSTSFVAGIRHSPGELSGMFGDAMVLLLVLGVLLLLLSAWPRDGTKRVLGRFEGLSSRPALCMAVLFILATCVSYVLIGRLSRDGSAHPSTKFVLYAAAGVLFIATAVLFSRKYVVRLLTDIQGGIREIFPGSRFRQAAGCVAIGILVPWLVLCVAAKGHPTRFWPFWSVEAVVITFFVAACWTFLLPRAANVMTFLCIALIVVCGGDEGSMPIRFLAHGAAGRADPPHYQALNFIAEDLKRQGKREATIGYNTLFQDWPADYHTFDSRYRIGADFDYLLERNFGITNLQTSPLGAGERDQYRIVEAGIPRKGLHKLDLPLDGYSLVFETQKFKTYRYQEAP